MRCKKVNKKLIFCFTLIGIFLLSKSLINLHTFAYFSGKSSISGTITAGYWVEEIEDACSIELDITNKTEVKLVNINIVAGVDSHKKNNYTITPSNIEDSESLGINETRTFTFEVDHREEVHCNVQWIYFDINVLDENGNEYELEKYREKVSNPPGKVKKEGYTTKYVFIDIDDSLMIENDVNNSTTKEDQEIENTEEIQEVDKDSNQSLEDKKAKEEKEQESVNDNENNKEKIDEATPEEEVEKTNSEEKDNPEFPGEIKDPVDETEDSTKEEEEYNETKNQT